MLYVVSASYDPSLNGIVLKLYNDKTERLEEWIDIDFKAYFLLLSNPDLNWDGIVKKEQIQKYDALRDKHINVWKISMKTPRLMKKSYEINRARENYIKFYQSYIFDNNIRMGMPHSREDGKLVFQVDQDAQHRIQEILDGFKGLTEKECEIFKEWTELMEYPAPDFKRTSLDIEVMNKDENSIPDSGIAILPVLTTCFSSNRGEKIAYVLIQKNKPIKKLPDNVNVAKFFSDEKKLLLAVFKKMNEYPFILTFNGDDFDLKYLYNRGIRLGIPKQEIPIIVKKQICMLKNAVHIDLYKFFKIKAMRIYAFKAKYKNVTLESVSQALLKKGKLKGDEKWVGKMTYHDLIRYCVNDADLTLELTTFNDNLAMNLILVLERISRLPMENVSRKNVSAWIRNFMLLEHRKRNILIPTPEELKTVKGETASMAVIKGKKYKGAIVMEPISGVHFGVVVLDFASLYPSIIKVYNIGYSTINCPHEECKSNTIGELPHWICTKHKSLESLLVGSLRDLRVFWYKKRAKDDSLDEKLKSWYSVAEQSIKVIMNASYGVFGAESFVLYCPPVAEEITAIARHIILQTIAHAQGIGIQVYYGDTDSIFVKKEKEEILKPLIDWTEKEFGIDFEVDKAYRYVCLSNRKKNYLGVLEDGDVDVKGLTGGKKHTPQIIKVVFNDTKEVLSNVTNESEISSAKGQITSLVKKVYSIFKNRSWKDINNLAFHVALGKEISEYKKTTPQHVKAAIMLRDEGYDVGSGTTISYIKTNKKLAQGKTVKPVELTKRTEVDITKYVEFLRSVFEQILDPLDIDFEEDIMGITKIDRWLHKT